MNPEYNEAENTQQPEQPQEQEQVNQPEVEQPEQPQENVEQNQESQQEQENSKDYNFKALREKADQAQREKEELERRVQEMEHYYQYHQQQQQQPQQPQQEEEDLSVSDDDFVSGKVFNRHLKKLEQQIKTQQQQTEAERIEQRLKNKYPDFDNVVNRKNVEKLKKDHPSVAAVLRDAKDLESQGDSAYLFIKQFGIAGDNYQQDKQKAQGNANKPRSVNSISPQSGDSPMSNANAFENGLTPELKEKLWKQMQEAIKNR